MTLATDVDVWREDPTGAAASTEPLALPASAGFAWGVTRRSSRAIGDAVTGDPGAPSDDWVYRLSHAGPDRDVAIAALYALLLRAQRGSKSIGAARCFRTCMVRTWTISRVRA